MGKNTVPVIDSSANVFAPQAPAEDGPVLDHSARVLALEGELSSARDTHGAELAKLRDAHAADSRDLSNAHWTELSGVKNELEAAHSELETLREKLKHVTSERDTHLEELDSTRELLDQRSGDAPPAAVIGATSNTASPSFEDLQADHPLKTDLPTRVGEPVGDPLVSQAPGSPVANR